MPRVIITVPDKSAQPYRFSLDRKVVSIGRGSSNDIVVDSGSVSGNHAEMNRIEGGYELADLGSTNGIKYDGSRERVLPLRSGMKVRIGDVFFDFSLTEEELETLAKEKPLDEPPIIKEKKLEESPSEARRESDRDSEPRRERPAAAHSGGGGGVGMFILFLILAVAAFVAGLAIRYQKDTDESLISAILNKAEAKKEAPAAE